MNPHKQQFTQLVLTVVDPISYTLADGRNSTYKIRFRELRTGASQLLLGQVYAAAVEELATENTALYGIPTKGEDITIVTAAELARTGRDIPYFRLRTTQKEHGIQDSQGPLETLVDGVLRIGDHIIILDDVITGGITKINTLSRLKELETAITHYLIANHQEIPEPIFSYPAMIVGVDRQETTNGEDGATYVTRKTGIPLRPIITATDLFQEAVRTQQMEKAEALKKQIFTHGTNTAKEILRKLGAFQ